MTVFTENNTAAIGEHHEAAIAHVLCRAATRLRSRLFGALGKISCEFDRGVLVLRGRLHSYYHKQLAQEAVADLEDVLQVVNQIEVVHRVRVA